MSGTEAGAGGRLSGTSVSAASPVRLDVLTARILGVSREEARHVVASGHVRAAGRVVDRPGVKLPADTALTISGGTRPYVSRGGEKLAHALAYFSLNVTGLRCLDVGASTGGFSDCLLKHGAAKVYAVENGTAQLAQALRDDARVVSMEQTDIRTVTAGKLGGPVAFAAVDVSFISQTKVLGAVKPLLKPGADLISLVKPQFEAGAGNVGKRGIVRDKAVRERAAADVCACACALGFTLRGRTVSPVNSGNTEFLLYFINGKE